MTPAQERYVEVRAALLAAPDDDPGLDALLDRLDAIWWDMSAQERREVPAP